MAESSDTDLLLPIGADADADADTDSVVSETSISSGRSGLSYKKLPDRVFFWTALLLLASMVFVAIVVSSVEAVFDFLGAFGCNSITFLFPALGYLVTLHRFGNDQVRKNCETRLNQIAACSFLVLWAVIFVAYIYLTVMKASSKSLDKEPITL